MNARNFILSLAIYAAIWAVGGWHAVLIAAIVLTSLALMIVVID